MWVRVADVGKSFGSTARLASESKERQSDSDELARDHSGSLLRSDGTRHDLHGDPVLRSILRTPKKKMIKPSKNSPFALTGIMPPSACANCHDTKDIAIVPYHEDRAGPMLAVLLLCGLCRRALANHELGVHVEIRVAGQKPWE
jgi:hypothetical protein